MRIRFRPKLALVMTALVSLAFMVLPLTASAARLHTTQTTSTARTHINCATGDFRCTEVYDSEAVFGEGHYVGHDEPSTLFYSNRPGSGNRMQWRLTLPKDPSPTDPLTPGKSFNFQLHPAFWFGMAMCDTQSYPEQVSTCTPDSDSNIVDPAISPNHPGTAFMELQFYPPGWVQQFAGYSCDATKWCAALTIDSLSENPVTGQNNNSACLSTVGIEPVNFAYVTKNGIPQAVPNPVQFNPADQTPDPKKVLFMNQGDHVVVSLHDTAHGLRTELQDLTTGESGFMTASAANGFGQVQFDPAGTTCNNIPYDFHPMYSTSSEMTRVPWAAHSYNIAFADEIGHFDFCNGGIDANGNCTGTEGNGTDTEPADGDDSGCFPASASLLVQVSGCLGTNDPGFDGSSYQPVWPDGNTKLHPTSILFSSPLTGSGYNVKYNRVAFEADLPRIEFDAGTCDRATGAGCSLIPVTDDGRPAAFYPFFSTAKAGGQCTWRLGNHIPGSTNDFGQNAQYGTLLNLTYTALGGAPTTRYNDFRQILSKNPC